MDKVAENLISGLAGLAAGYIVAEGYKQLVSTSEKKSWERDVGIHHGEAGIALLGAGSASSAFCHYSTSLGLLHPWGHLHHTCIYQIRTIDNIACLPAIFKNKITR